MRVSANLPFLETFSFKEPPLIASPATQLRTQESRSLERAQAAARVADLNRARDIAIIDLREITPVFDFFVLATGNSRRQLHSIAEEIDAVLKKQFGDRKLGLEGYEDSRWILLDFGDVVIHLFDEETREYYDLEHLWAGAKRIPYVSSDLPAVENRMAEGAESE